MSLLHALPSLVQRSAKRLGRGMGSGKGGHTVGRGTKGQRARKSGEAPMWFEGGALAMVKRMPMIRGKGRFNVVRPCAEVTLSEVQKMKSPTVTLDSLKIERVIDHRFRKAKIIATGEIQRAVSVQGVAVSAQAKAKIEAAGGQVA